MPPPSFRCFILAQQRKFTCYFAFISTTNPKPPANPKLHQLRQWRTQEELHIRQANFRFQTPFHNFNPRHHRLLQLSWRRSNFSSENPTRFLFSSPSSFSSHGFPLDSNIVMQNPLFTNLHILRTTKKAVTLRILVLMLWNSPHLLLSWWRTSVAGWLIPSH